MYLTILFIALWVICLVWLIVKPKSNASFVFFVIIFCINIFNAIIVLGNYSGVSREIASFKAVQSTVTEQRADTISSLERVRLIDEIITWNKWLAGEKWFGKSKWLNWYTRSEIMNLNPIK